MLESGGIDIDPDQMKRVIAISAGNSIFVAAKLLSDPARDLPASTTKRIIGNIGSAGLSLLVVPENLRIRPESNDLRAVQHIDYDYKRQNSFEGTSLHLLFTGWKVPLVLGTQGFIDQDVHFLEVVVEVRDRGLWVADIDILGGLSKMAKGKPIGKLCVCGGLGLGPRETTLKEGFISIDCWDELLDPPHSGAIIRGHGNWAARLAAVCISLQKYPNRPVIPIGKQPTCWRCFGAFPTDHNEEVMLVD
jgi:hypothetical protein